MAFGFIKNILDTNQKELNRYQRIVDQINDREDEMRKLKDKEFATKTQEFKQRITEGENLDDILPEAFALVREAAYRILGMRAYDVQLLAAITFHEGRVAEQKTGEGKTLSAVPALYLNALMGKGAHLVTVNDYLARVGAGWNAPVFEFLGLSTGVIYQDSNNRGFVYDSQYLDETHDDPRLQHLKPVNRKESYQADITYGTNTEFGFDYLRDNMAQSKEQQNQRGHHFAIVDEVDSILIDEARTPLIISAPDNVPTDQYAQFTQLANRLQSESDYTVDEKIKSVSLTEYGIKKVERILNVDNLYEKDFDTIAHIENALKAKTLYLRDTHYVVQNGEIIIVDEFTGRLMPGRRWSQGLHQAVEAKEGVAVQQESRTLATISLQNYFRMYDKLAGMTGTAATEAEEFRKIYKLEAVVIPTHRPIARVDKNDIVYKTTAVKYTAIVKKINELYEKGQPVLIGTTSIDKNEIIAKLLTRKGIPHNILNAKNHEREATIIAQAGLPHAVTVATNIAGRGIDIVLGGVKPEHPGRDADSKTKKKYDKDMAEWQKRHDEVIQLGGLYVIGTERHESRRIDNQLRGRSGRQGDPGESQFYVALDDEIMRLFGGDNVARLMTAFKLPDDQPLDAKMVSRAIEQAQIKVEGFHFDQRKHLVEYDDVMNKQREIIYKLRQKALEEHNFSPELQQKAQTQIDQLIDVYTAEGFDKAEVNKITQELAELIPMPTSKISKLRESITQKADPNELKENMHTQIRDAFKQKEKEISPDIMRQIERATVRMTIDQLWMDHLDAIDDLREGIGLRGYAQRDPLVEYKQEAFGMFENLTNQIDYQVVRRVLRAQVQIQTQAQSPISVENAQTVHARPDLEAEVADIEAQETITSPAQTNQTSNKSNDLSAFASAMSGVDQSATSSAKTTHTGASQQKISQKIGRNDPCPCGSGKKWKKCHYPELPA